MINLNSKLKNNNYTYIIAEIGLNHNGDVDIAKKLIKIAKESGADAVKLQKRDVSNLATNEILDAEDLRFPEFGDTYRKVREHLEFNKKQYLEIKKFSRSLDIDFLCTAFDINSLNFLEDIKIDLLKVASHSVTNIPLIEEITKRNINAIVSTGMSELEDIDYVYDFFQNSNSDLYLLHCISSYPTPDNEINLNIIDTLKEKYKDTIIGYSGHEMGFFTTYMAVAKGARIVERHITLDKNMIGFDHTLSLEPDELKEMILGVRRIEQILGTKEKKVTEVELFKKNQYNVSMIAKSNIKKGTVLNNDIVIYKNPGNGILFKNGVKLYGKVFNQDVAKDEIIRIEYLD